MDRLKIKKKFVKCDLRPVFSMDVFLVTHFSLLIIVLTDDYVSLE